MLIKTLFKALRHLSSRVVVAPKPVSLLTPKKSSSNRQAPSSNKILLNYKN